MIHVVPFVPQTSGLPRTGLPGALCVPSNVEYQKAYKQDWTYRDVSFALHEQASGALLAYMCATFGEDGQGRRELSYYGLPAVCVVLGEESAALRHSLASAVRKLLAQHKTCEVVYRENVGLGGLSAAAERLLQAGLHCHLSFKSVLDLTCPGLWAGVRKSYRPLIRKGQKLFTQTLITAATVDDAFFSQFKDLHVRVSGRQTRSDLSWRRQYEAVCRDEAFAVASSLDGSLCGVSYYITNGVTCYYGVGAYDRALFAEHPVSHASLWMGIEHARDRGCVHFEMGEVAFPFQAVQFSEKERGISTFKQGFGGDIFPVLTLRGHIYDA